MTKQPTNDKKQTTFNSKEQITKSTVGGTTYIVTSAYKEQGDGLTDKLWRLIQNDTNY